jgi:hypothetical protein
VISSSIPDWELRQRLSCLEGSEALPEDVPPGTVDRLFAALGSEDPHLGDEIGAATLARWIVIQHALPADQRRRLHARARGPAGARHRIGESGTTSVFRRSFSILLLAFIQAADNATRFLTNDEWEGSLDTLVSCGQQEQDVRASVSRLGWAHSVAHASDLADELRNHRVVARHRRRRSCRQSATWWRGAGSLSAEKRRIGLLSLLPLSSGEDSSKCMP